jgi:hypothetical protein
LEAKEDLIKTHPFPRKDLPKVKEALEAKETKEDPTKTLPFPRYKK